MPYESFNPAWFEARRKQLLAGGTPGAMPDMAAQFRPQQPGLGGESPMGMPPPMGPGLPGGAGMPMSPFPQGAAPPVPQPQGGPPPGMGMGIPTPPPTPPGTGMGIPTPPPGMGSYGAPPPRQQPPAWFPGPPVAKPRPPPQRPSMMDMLTRAMGQPTAPPAPAHEPEAGRVPQPVGDASGYDPTAAYGGARGSTYEMPAHGGTTGGYAHGGTTGGAGDTSFGHSTSLMDWIASRMGWR